MADPGTTTATARARTLRMLASESTLVEVVTALEAADVRPLLLKGAAFARWLYDDPTERPWGDIDLLIDPVQMSRAEIVLGGLGFFHELRGTRPHENTTVHSEWVRPGNLVWRVELHHTLYMIPAPPVVVWERFSAEVSSIDVGGTRIQVPSEATALLIASIHAAKHGVRVLKPMHDLERALERASIASWEAAAKIAHELGAAEGFAAGIRLTPAGERLADRLQLGIVTPRHIRLRTITPPDTAWGIEELVRTRGIRPRLQFLLYELAPSPDFMRTLYPGARTGRAGLVFAYLARPFRLAGKLPRGLLAWARVAAASRRA